METEHNAHPSPVMSQPKLEDKPKKSGGKLKVILVAILFLALGAGVGYYYTDMKAQDELDQAKQETANLKIEKAKVEQDLSDAKKAEEKTTVVKSTEVTQEQLDKIIDAVGSSNYAALQSYLANPVKVVIAASEFSKDRTPTEAITDIKYLDTTKDPWDFDLPATALSEYRAGDYKQYFPTKALVGKSSDGKVVAFGFNTDGKINLIFMASSADIL
jgi:hypothetical protein